MIVSKNYIRLSSFYFFFFAALGAFVPYWASYLKSLGFNSAQIGELVAVVMASKIVSPYLISWLADHLQKRLVIIQALMFCSIVVFAGVLPHQSYWWFVLVMSLFGFLWNSTLPLFEALTLNHLSDDAYGYSNIRLWGSIGFSLLVIALPPFISGEDIRLLPWIILALLTANGLSTLFIKDQSAEKRIQAPVPIGKVLRTPYILAFLVACALQTLSHGAYYTFFTIYLEDHGYTREFAGWMWALGVVAEVILFLLIRGVFSRFRISTLFIVSLLITSIRWVILALWVDNLLLLLFAQILHAASFGLFHATAIYLTHQLFPGNLQARGQALYAGMSFGVGGSIGHLLSGYSWDSLGATTTFLAAGLIAFIGAMIAAKFINEENLPKYANRSE